MIQTLQFLTQLVDNNNREWFEKNKPVYEEVKKEELELATKILKEMLSFEPEMSSLKPKDCVFRIYRDVRFSKDKSPYKTNLGIYFNSGGKNSFKAGYYLHIQPGQCFQAGGMWFPMAENLKKIRQEIDYSSDKFHKAIDNKDFIELFGKLDESEKLKKSPKDYPVDHPEIEYLKLKSFIAHRKISDEFLTSSDFPVKLAETWKTLKPLNDFLNDAVSE